MIQEKGKILDMKLQKVLGALFILLLFGVESMHATAQDGNPEAGAKKNAMCQGCHGIPGFRTAYPTVYTVPKLGGQNALYLVNALKAYKSGGRTHPGMRAVASALSDQDIADLAAYYSENKKIIVSTEKGTE